MLISHESMLAQWKLRRYVEPLRSDCTVVRSDGADTDSLLTMEIRDWYLDLLDHGPVEMLSPVDVTDESAVRCRGDFPVVEVTLPEGCRRVTEVRLRDNHRRVVVTTAGTPLAMLQESEFSCGGEMSPVAVVMSPRRLNLYGHDSSGNPPEIERLLAVRLPPDGFYELDERALSTIKTVEL